jgi:threonyl-tRNA synthetase
MVRVLVVSDRFRDYAKSIVQSLKQQNIRAEVDNTGERLGKQIRACELEKIPVTVVIGQRELDNQSLSVRTRSRGDIGTMTLPQLTEEILKANAAKSSSY